MKKYIFLIFTALPSFAYATSNIFQLTVDLRSLLSYVVPMIIGLALVAFLWGIIKYLFGGEDEGVRKESKQFMIWGIVGLTVMVSLWSLVSIFANLFGMHINTTPTLPPKY